MILQDLVNAYSALEKQGIVKNGWNLNGAVHYGIDIDTDGRVKRVIPFVDNKKPKMMPVPIMVGKETGKADFDRFLYGNSRYLLGYAIDKNGITERLDSFKHTGEYQHKLLDKCQIDAAKAAINYFDYYLCHHNELYEECNIASSKDYKTSFFTLCYNGVPILRHPEIVAIWDEEFALKIEQGSARIGISLVSGKRSHIAKTHNSVLGVGGTNPSLISFNASSFESYGLEQSYNASISVLESLKYTGAINAMIKDDRYHSNIGDIHLIMWAANTDPLYSDVMAGLLGDSNKISQDDLINIVNHIAQGKTVNFDEKTLSPDEKFFIAGISANGGRIIVEFYFENSFGSFLNNINIHNQRMRLSETESTPLSVYQILMTTVRFGAGISKTLEKKILGMILKSVLFDSHYPDSIYSGIISRIRKRDSVSVNKAKVLKMILIKNNPNVSREVAYMGLDKESENLAYNCGRLFAVLEKVQKDTGVENLAEKHFASAMTTPAIAFSKIMRLNQYYLKKLPVGNKIYYDNLIQSIMHNIRQFPRNFLQAEQGVFCLGYYHQKQELYQKKENK